jgi:transposase
MENRIEMSQRERDVLKVMATVLKGERTQVEAANLLGKSVRQVRRIQRRLEAEGDVGVVHRLRGRPSNRQSNASLREQVLTMYRQELRDFGPTLASEVLAERGLVVSHETLRHWLLAEGLWTRKRRRDKHRSRRPRKECFGELVQADASIHDWLEGRGEDMALVAFIDDATSRMIARFYPAETTEAYLDLLGRWIAKHGRAVALYTDRDSVFVTPTEAEKTLEKTQFGRACDELDIEWIPAGSPQAKGRVERLFGTLQDRWVKAMRLAHVTTRAKANELLENKLLPEFNRRFTCRPTSTNDAHRPLGPRHNLAAILSIQSHRTVANDYTVRFHNHVYQLHKPVWPGLRRGRVIMEERLDGSLAIRFRERYLAFSDLGALPPNPRGLTHRQHPAEANEGRAPNETRPSAVTLVDRRSGRTPAEPYPPADSDKSTLNGPYKPPATHPWRRKLLINTRQ